MSEEMNTTEEMELLTLTDEDGKEMQFEFLDVVEYENKEYVVLLPVDGEEEESEEVVILRVDEVPGSPDEESYSSLTSQEELDAVFAIFKEKFKDEFNFTDGE